MTIQELLQRSLAIREAYRGFEIKQHGSEWTIEEDLLGLSNDIGNLNRLVMTKQERYYDETPYILEQKLAENIWWLVELSQRLGIDLEKEVEIFLSDKEERFGISNIGTENKTR
ncbi:MULTISPECIES: MazG-like protein [unclassified Streptococcus]|uniref:MazG-like protein n=1 Tax=unclassified Streptococcus TaxID=2608887 RepID=UPI00107258B3|nr:MULTISPECIES: MazG-like protein [unclassified Streptococcus]MBF0786780.1 MazG-like protein [Streptococcus sp. 19428wC2_LYSM12]MCQ9211019.1 MazG-like protein [Streptococcus sp. B01]MCQ9214294.1 MazG-like protein [Streptococcus sp. O1]TFV06321.1 MazG-like protein [Streptococcus sp. LYSM12]